MEILPKVDPPEDLKDINHYMNALKTGDGFDARGFNDALNRCCERLLNEKVFCPLCKKDIIAKNYDRHELSKAHLKKLEKCKS